jgi:hypothetical protein
MFGAEQILHARRSDQEAETANERVATGCAVPVGCEGLECSARAVHSAPS